MVGEVDLASCRSVLILRCLGTDGGRFTPCKAVVFAALLALFNQVFHEKLFLGEATRLHTFAEAE